MSATDDIVAGIMAKWADNFRKFDADAQASLYSTKALFYGSKPTLFRGRDGVAAYFNGLKKWDSREVTFTDVVAVPAGDDVINMAGIANFVIDNGATTLTVKITWVIVREGGDWKILSHHVSPPGALI
jgi:ketosteroid isomerase-like protein